MALSLNSIYQPVNDFFINKFKTDAGSPVFFRFDKFGSAISDEDFYDPADPDFTADAQEAFSDLTNRIPVEDSDDVNIFFSASLIDSEYNRLLKASLPFADNEDSNREQIINSFITIKADANREWERLSTPRGGGIADYYRLSFATPSNWYDRTNNEIWTSQSFEIKESVAVADNSNPKFQLWKMKLNDEHLQEILPALKSTKPIQPIALRKDVMVMKPMIGRAGIMPKIIVRDHRTKPVITVHDHRTENKSTVVQNLRTGLHGLGLTNRLAVLQYIRQKAPTQPSTTNSIKISFKYCPVSIRRPWCMSSFTKSKSWFIPGTEKGEESAPGSEINLSALPIGFIAIKDLVIEANWSQVDITAAKNATNFGPFEINSEITDNKMSHEGIQIGGWLLERMNDLPPNSASQ
jgi:hypothetical protein